MRLHSGHQGPATAQSMDVDPREARGHGGTGGRLQPYAGLEKGGVRTRDQVLFAWGGKEGRLTRERSLQRRDGGDR